MAKDLVCGMKVDEKKTVDKADYKGKTYYFCTPPCKEKFEKNPEKYITRWDSSPQRHHM